MKWALKFSYRVELLVVAAPGELGTTLSWGRIPKGLFCCHASVEAAAADELGGAVPLR